MATKKKPKGYGYKVKFDRFCEVDDDGCESSGEYSQRPDEYWYNHLLGVTKDQEWPDVVSSHDFQIGDTAYLVWVEYSSGDSFGVNELAHTECVALCKTKEVANEMLEHLHKSEKQEFGIKKITLSDRQMIKFYQFWVNCFCNIHNFHVDKITIKENDNESH